MDFNDQQRLKALKMVDPSQWLERDIDFLEVCYAQDAAKLESLRLLKAQNFGAKPYVTGEAEEDADG